MEVKSNKKDIRSLSFEELEAAIKGVGQPKFRAKQVYEWLWKKGARSYDEMTNVPKKLRWDLEGLFTFHVLKEDVTQFSTDGTIKSRFRLHDGHLIEAVLIPVPKDKRFTVCVSCQVGCSLSCSFCATGKMKLARNLTPAEIYDQYMLVNEQCEQHFGYGLTNIVYMGMGEPLLAYKNVLTSIEKFTGEDGLGMSPRRITVSTAGIAKIIRKLADTGVKVNMALSLHAADDEKRNEIMPINETNNLANLMEALEYFYQQTKNRISYEYIAFSNFNDSIEDAQKLEKLCRRFPVRINIIEYNQVDGVVLEKATEDRINTFAKYLVDRGVMTTVRRSRGKDIDAACGQLANKG